MEKQSERPRREVENDPRYIGDGQRLLDDYLGSSDLQVRTSTSFLTTSRL